MTQIEIRGARTHNLKNIDVRIPRDKLTVITGLSGSGKSSLAFDTLYAEGQRRYVESLSAYARQFLSMAEKPDVDSIEGLSPAISIEQKATSHNPRSTVGTITEIYDYLRLLFARVGTPHCPRHDAPLSAQSVTEIVDELIQTCAGTRQYILAPLIRRRKGEHRKLLVSLQERGFVRARVDGDVCLLDELPELNPKTMHTIELVVDRLTIEPEKRLRVAESLETAVELAQGRVSILPMDDEHAEPRLFSTQFSCSECGYSLSELEPRLFSFNNPAGACPECEGLGSLALFDADLLIPDKTLSLNEGAIRGWDRRHPYFFDRLCNLAEHFEFSMDAPFNALEDHIKDLLLRGSKEKVTFHYKTSKGRKRTRTQPFEGILTYSERRYRETESSAVREELSRYLTQAPCPKCQGARLNEAARHVRIAGQTLQGLSQLSIQSAQKTLLELSVSKQKQTVFQQITQEIDARLSFLLDVGLSYLTLERSAETLSGGEAQRIRLASQIGSGLVGVMYVLDEPSIGLHPRDNTRLLNTLFRLRDLGNTVIVVEHDEEAIRAADHVIDIGPGAGVHGGQIVAEGTPGVIESASSLTGDYLSGKRSIAVPTVRKPFDATKVLSVRGASSHNLKHIDVDIPLGLMVCVTGVSGSGKSSLVNDTVYPHAARELNRARTLTPGPCRSVEGWEHLDKVVNINQSPIGRTPRSNPATYTGMFTAIRELFAATEEARSRGYKPGRFSFNVRGGRCEACEGDGLIKVEMHFLADVYVPCEVCAGKRYNTETLSVRYKGKTIHEVLSMTVEEALVFFEPVLPIARRCQTLMDVGLGYLQLGQSATTLSGGEAQRVKLAKELSKRDTGQTLYILDEPTTGLHFEDVNQLLSVLTLLKDKGNTVLVIEHHLDVIKTADWLIDLGPEGGDGGGTILACGTPEQLSAHPDSVTGVFLKETLENVT